VRAFIVRIGFGVDNTLIPAVGSVLSIDLLIRVAVDSFTLFCGSLTGENYFPVRVFCSRIPFAHQRIILIRLIGQLISDGHGDFSATSSKT